jgi:hypothetical protein
MADVRNVLGSLGVQLQAVIDENDRQVLAGTEMQQEKKQRWTG